MAKQWIVDNSDVYTEDEIDNLLDRICDPENYENEDDFDDYLNQEHNCYRINGREFTPAEILKSCDEEGYYEDLREYAENEAEYAKDDVRSDLENMDDGDRNYWNGYTVICEYIEEEEEEEETVESDQTAEMWQSIFSVHTV